MITLHRLYQPLTGRRNHKAACAVAGPNRPADKLNSLQDTASPEACYEPHRAQLPHNTRAGNIIYAGACGVAEGRSHPALSAGRSALNLANVDVNRRSAANILINNAHNAGTINLNPQTHKRIYKSKSKRTVERQIQGVIDLADISVIVELVKNDIFKRRSFAEHLRLPAGSAGTAHRCNAIIDFQIAVRLQIDDCITAM